MITGLVGTLAMPRLERLVGLERAGAWSIWSVLQLLTVEDDISCLLDGDDDGCHIDGGEKLTVD